VKARYLRPAAALATLAGLAAGCAGHRAQVREFERGRETAFFREQAARARTAGPPAAAPGLAETASLEELRARQVRRIEERDELAGLLDLSDPAARAAFEAGADGVRTRELLAKGPVGAPEVLALAAARSPAVRAARETWRATVERIDQAAWLEQVTAAYRGFSRGTGTRVGGEGPAAPRAMERESYPWPAATALRGEMADLESAMARERLRATLAEALATAREAHGAAFEAAGRETLLAGFLPFLRSMAEVAAARYGAGRGRRDEQLRVETEIRRMETDLASARNDRAAAEARLRAVLDLPGDAPLAATAPPAVPKDSPAVEALARRAATSSPTVAMAERSLELARVAIRTGEIMSRPPSASAAPADPGLRAPAGGGMEGEGTGGDAATPGAAMGLGPSAPWYGVEEAYLRELRRRAAAAESDLAGARRDAEATARDAWRMLDTALRELRTAEATAVPLAEQAFEVSRRDYQTGAADFAMHLEAWGELVRARSSALEARLAAARGLAMATRATGSDPTMEDDR
jgi:cobalt-zinc-cadmium efflux system outer membrane protein